MARAPLISTLTWPWLSLLRDRAAPRGWQAGLQSGDGGDGAGQLWGWALARRGIRLRLLVVLRWVLLAGELVSVIWAGGVMRLHMPILGCFAVIALGALANLVITRAWPVGRLVVGREAALHIGVDVAQLSLILMLTGGADNPFSIFLVAPVVVAAATLNTRDTIAVSALALVALGLMWQWSFPLPYAGESPTSLPRIYEWANLIATAVGIVYTALYAWQAQAETRRMEVVLAATQAVLAREQRLSALGGLAAAAAHELGTPLATIQVVAKEMLRAMPSTNPLHEDVQLLSQQAERCRDILRRLARSPDAADERHSRMSLVQLLEEVAEPHRGAEVFIGVEVGCAVGAAVLEVERRAEVLHGLSAFVENAVDFAESAVELTAFYDARTLTVTVRDDGPGFSPEVMAKLGEPYVTTRGHGEGSRSGHLGMGLGFFIAKTLLERSGARVEFGNSDEGGALISVIWLRSRLEMAVDA